MRRSAVVFACLLILPMLMSNDVSAQPKPFGVRDLVAMDRLSEPAASPDGSAIVFTVSVLDAEANRRRSDLWWVKADGTGLRRLTDDPASDSRRGLAPGRQARLLPFHAIGIRAGVAARCRFGASRRR